ncbi:MAG TPA: phosphatidate cytidylyltransferase [Blastocatellia bacterium]|nr:phosphatidate cytidylyltransferase [Blastocatellia bacterium]
MKRILTAAVALPVLIYTVWSEIPYFFVALATVSVFLALREFYKLAWKVECRADPIPGHLSALLVVACFVFDRPVYIPSVLAALAIAALAFALSRPDKLDRSLASVSATVFGVVYTALLAGYLIGIRMAPDAPGTTRLAPKLLTMFFALVMMTDTGAYYAGRALGRHKLAPRISPGKTVEGSVGGFLAAVITGPLCKLIFFPEISIAHAAALGAALGILGQVGDLAESMLKRGAGVKDSGNLLPGHGGMLDRVDSILFCAPVVYYYSRLLIA